MSYSLIPTADYKAACDAIRAKTGKTDLIKSGDMASEVNELLAFNIHYGTEAPEDTSKLWVKTDTKPTQTCVTNNISGNCSIKTMAATLPTAADSMAAGVVGTKIYLFGGNSPYDLDTINVFDTETNTITTLSTTLPQRTLGMVAGVVGTKIYLFGGFDGFDRFDTINVFDTETNTITTLSTTLPIGASSMAAGVVGTKIYLFGGNSGSRLDTINVFDTETNTITTLSTTLPTATNSMAAGVVGTKIYMFGGQSDSDQLDTIVQFDIVVAVVVPSLTENVFPLMDVVELGVYAVYITNADGEAEQVNAYLYNESTAAWEEVI